MAITTVPCPTCKTQVEWSTDNPYRPFCSKRCQLIDLGEWAKEEHRLPTDPEDLEPEDWQQLERQFNQGE